MFTGLVEEVGTLKQVSQRGESLVLQLAARHVLEGVRLGDSIAVNGVCLTVIASDATSFAVDVTPQTYRYTNLQLLRPGQPVNLERAMQAGGRFGGHIVQGHVDGVGIIARREPEGNAVNFTIRPAQNQQHLLRYIVPQGSITVDGISLTVAGVEDGAFRIAIIPHTLRATALYDKQPGATVNLETDILGKYVEHLLRYGRAGGKDGHSGADGQSGQSGQSEDAEQSHSAKRSTGGLSAAFLTEHGFA